MLSNIFNCVSPGSSSAHLTGGALWLLIILAYHASAQATFTSASAGTWTSAASWTCSGTCAGRSYPADHLSVTNDVVIINHSITFSDLVPRTVGSITIDNLNANLTQLRLTGLVSLSVVGNVSVIGLSTQNAVLQIDGGASMAIGGGLTLTRGATQAANRTVRLVMTDLSSLTVNGDLAVLELNTVGGTETFREIDLGRSGTTFPIIDVGGNFNITLNSTVSGNLISTQLAGASQMRINGDVSFNFQNSGDQSIQFLLSNSTTASVGGADLDPNLDDAASSVFAASGDFLANLPNVGTEPDVITFVRGSSSFSIDGIFSVNHSKNLSTSDFDFYVFDHGSLACGDLNMTSSFDNGSRDIYLNLAENSYATINGDLTMDSNNQSRANYIRVEGMATFDLKGEVVRANDALDGRIEFVGASANDNPVMRFSGSAVQSLFRTYSTSATDETSGVGSGVTARVYRTLVIDNSAGVSVPPSVGPVVVRNGLLMNTGVLSTNASAYLVFPNMATPVTSNLGNAGSYIDGPVRKIGPTNLDVPLGDGIHWAPISISNLVTSGTPATAYPDLMMEYQFAMPPDVTNRNSFDHVSGAEYWSMTSRQTDTEAITASIQFYWSQACVSEITNLSTTVQDLYLAARTNAAWALMYSTSFGPGSEACDPDPDDESGSLSVTGIVLTPTASVTDYYFTFASLGNSGNPLPVTLIWLDAKFVTDGVEIRWETATELNSEYFIVQQSIDGVSFHDLGTLNAAGTSNSKCAYRWMDSSPADGKNYYRLVEVDVAGQRTYSSVVGILALPQRMISIYPNPINRFLFISGLKQRDSFFVSDCTGSNVTDKVKVSGYSLEKEMTCLDFSQLPTGIYILKVDFHVFRIVKE